MTEKFARIMPEPAPKRNNRSFSICILRRGDAQWADTHQFIGCPRSRCQLGNAIALMLKLKQVKVAG